MTKPMAQIRYEKETINYFVDCTRCEMVTGKILGFINCVRLAKKHHKDHMQKKEFVGSVSVVEWKHYQLQDKAGRKKR